MPSQLFTSARQGSNSCLGRLLTLYTNYLKLLVAAQLDNRLRAGSARRISCRRSFFEAHRDFEQFRGQSPGEFVAWLRRIVVNNILRVVEQHVLAEKRDVRREVSLEEIGRRLEQSTVRLETLLAERTIRPAAAPCGAKTKFCWPTRWPQLPADYREVIVLRHIEGLPFEEVAQRMERTAGAVRMLWLRALKKLREQIEEREVA